MTKDLVLVLTMGRVGSTATFRAVDGVPGVEALHIHHIRLGGLVRRGGLVALASGGRKASRHVRDGYQARDLLKEANRPVKVITLVRDVVERNLSVGFARLRHMGQADELERLVEDRRLVERIWRRVDVDLPNTWFDKEIRKTFGIDVFARRFPLAGHERFKEGRCDLLVIRSDVPDDLKASEVSDLLGHPVVVKHNNWRTREGGQLGGVYDSFKRAVPLTDDDLRQAAQSQLMQHFFEVDPEEYVRTWRRRLGR